MKTVLLLVDGMRPDSLSICGHPYFMQLYKASLSTLEAKTVFPSVTLPCHMSLFHSVDPGRHGVLTNIYTPQVRPVEGLFERLHRNGLVCASFYNWEELRDLSRPGSLDESLYLHPRQKNSDCLVTDYAIRYIQENIPDFVFVYLGLTDAAGHDYGWMGKEYLTAVANASACAEKLIDSLPEGYITIVTADHGGHLQMHGEDIPEDMTIPLMIYGDGIRTGHLPQASIKDIAPTITTLLNVPPAREWEGNSLIK